MTDERWQQFVEMAQDTFDNVEITREDLTAQTIDGPEVRGYANVLIFEKDGDRYKLERENKPLVLERTEHHAKRANDTARIDYKFSDTEFTHKLRVFKENDLGDWDEISTAALGL